MKKILYLLSIVLVVSSCMKTREKITNKAIDLLGKPTSVFNDSYLFTGISFESAHEKGMELKEYIDRNANIEPNLADVNLTNIDGSGHHTLYKWINKQMVISLFINYAPENNFIRLTVRYKKSSFNKNDLDWW